MSIWEHRNSAPLCLNPEEKARLETYWLGGDAFPSNCRYCSSEMTKLPICGYYDRNIATVHVCRACGWWTITHITGYSIAAGGARYIRRACGVLRDLDLTDITTPTVELTRHLIAKYENRFTINPRSFEDVVAGVFSDFNYKVRVTSYSGDGGIDIIVLDGDQGDTIGVQVKRYANKIEAEQIRSFAGALMLSGTTKGIFVTTSNFTKGAQLTSRQALTRGLQIELWNADQFYDKMRFAQRSMFTFSDDPSAPFNEFVRNPQHIPIIDDKEW